MEDRVAEVLGQRAALDHGFIAGVLVSIFLHTSLVVAAVYVAIHTPAPKIASVLNIKFAPMRAPAVVQAPVPAKPAAPRIESPKPQPLKPIETKKPPEKNTVPISPFGRSEKKGSENPVVAPPPNPATPQPGNPATEAGVSAAAIEGGDFPYTIYIDRMTTLIGSRFFRPQGANTTVVIVYTIERDGTIRDAAVESPSGNGALDRAALRAVVESSPLGPLPFGYSGTYLRVHLRFR